MISRTLCVFFLSLLSLRAAPVAELRRTFVNPPDDSRIMMRWWWFGPSVTKAEIARELKLMKEGGTGGVEVQPVYPLALDDAAAGTRNLPFLSGEFIDALRFAAAEARRLGLRLDVTLGSGWPYGGPHIPVNRAAGKLRWERVRIGESRRIPVPAIADGEKLLAAFAVSAGGAYRELEGIQNGVLSTAVRIPPGFISSPTPAMFGRASTRFSAGRDSNRNRGIRSQGVPSRPPCSNGPRPV